MRGAPRRGGLASHHQFQGRLHDRTRKSANERSESAHGSRDDEDAPTWSGITPRWLVSFLPWALLVEAGIYRLNRVKEATALSDADVQCSPARDRDADLPETFVDYEDAPREYSMNAVTTILDVQTRVSDLYNHPYDQILRSRCGFSPRR